MKRNTQTAIENSSVAAINSSMYVLTQLLENLKNYRECVIDYFHLTRESADTDTEYSVGAFSQSHTLPGIIAIPEAHNLQGITSNGEKTEQLKTAIEKNLKQKRIFWRLIEKDSNLYFQALKGLKSSDTCFEEFIEILNDTINLSLQPNKIANKPDRLKPSIKLEVKSSAND
jgi:hypothetical protein